MLGWFCFASGTCGAIVMTRPIRDVLLLLTAEYPYGVKETYLDGEIPFLAHRFERVFIVSGATERGHARPVPANVTVVDLPASDEALPIAVRLSVWRAVVEELWAVVARYRLLPRRSLLRSMWAFLRDGKRFALGMQAFVRARKIPPERVVAYSYWAMESAMGCAILKRLEPRVAAVTRAHGYDVYFERHGLPYRPFRRRLVRWLDAFYVVSGHGAAYTERKTGTRLNPTLQVRYLGAKGASTRIAAASPAGIFTLVTCAALIPLKRIGLFIDALAEACSCSSGQRVHWQHFGGGPLETEIAAHASRVLSGSTNISYTLAGHVPHQVILDFLDGHHVDLMVSASEWEGLPVSMMEAMARGVPVVATDVGGCSEIVRDGANGRIVARDPTPAELGAAIRAYLDLPAEVRQLFRSAAHQTWEQQFSVDKNYADFAVELCSLA
jgi:colanic acid/amylovoran biosynthesis glycosyltransferase